MARSYFRLVGIDHPKFLPNIFKSNEVIIAGEFNNKTSATNALKKLAKKKGVTHVKIFSGDADIKSYLKELRKKLIKINKGK